MKTIIISILILACITCKAQQTCRDSALLQIQMDFKHMRTNIQKAKDLHNTGLILHVVGAWSQVIAYTGYKHDYYDKKSYNEVAIYSIGFNLLAFGFELYSHKFVNKAIIQMSPNGVRIKF